MSWLKAYFSISSPDGFCWEWYFYSWIKAVPLKKFPRITKVYSEQNRYRAVELQWLKARTGLQFRNAPR